MAKSKRIIVSVTNDLYTDQRVHKVCMFLLKQGYDVLLVGRKRRSSVPLPKRDYETKRMKLLFEKGALFYAAFNLRLFLLLLFKKSDILLANDLDTLLANYVATKFKRNTALVYDSHEYFTEVPELEGRRAKKVWERIEGWIFPKLTKIYTVNQSIADVYQKKYKKELKVVRNISPKWEMEKLESHLELGLPEDKKLIIIQGAGINVDRGGEEAVEAMKSVENGVLIIVGDGDVVPQLKEFVAKNDLSEKVLFFGKQPYDRMMNFSYYASIGLTLDKNTNLNYAYSLPNKVFDYIHSNTALICTNLVEVKKVVEKNEIGIVMEELNPTILASTINELLANQTQLNRFIENCKIASEKEHWDKEVKILKDFFPKIV